MISKGVSDEFTGYVDADYGSYDYVSVEGAVAGPLTDRLGFRLAMLSEQGGGFMDGEGAGSLGGYVDPRGVGIIPPIADPGPRDGFGDKDMLAMRATLGLVVNDSAALTLKVFASQDQGETQQSDRVAFEADPVPARNAGENDDPYSFYTSEYYERDVEVRGLSASYRHGLPDDLSLDIIAGFQQSDREVGGNGDGGPFRRFPFVFQDDLEQASLEVRLSDDAGGQFDWIVGAFFIDDTTEFFSEFSAIDSTLTVYTTDHVQTRTSVATFAHVDYHLNSVVSDTFHSKFSCLLRSALVSEVAASFNSRSNDCFSNGVTLRICNIV